MGNELLRKGDDDEDKKETADITGSSMLVTTSTVDDGSNDGQSIVEVLGLECLSIVLSYLTECDGTCLLLCRQHYWTDTVLPLFRRRRRRPSASWDGANGTTNNTTTTTTAAAKYRHTYQVVTIPDATVRLARLNTRRWSTKQKQQQKQKQDRCRIDRRHKDINDTTPIITTKGSLSSSSSSIIMKTTEELAENEWNTTTTTVVTNTLQHVSHHDEYALPYLLRMYNANPPANSKSKQAPTIPTLPPVFRQGLTSIASYPRSGNTLLRNLLETVTGYVTSSDTRPDRTLSRALADRPPYFVGEGLAPNNNTNNNNPNNVSNTNTSTNHYVSPFLTPSLPSPPICKTHWPERVGCHVYQSNRVVLLIRNPYDTVDSYWHMNLTNTHTQKVRPGITHHHKAFYVSLVKDEICSVWLPFIQYYYTTCKTQNIPLLFVRYEDLIMNQKHELHRILQFVCCNDTNTNNYNNNNNDNNNNDNDDYQTQEGWWKHRLDEVTRKNTSFGYRSSSSSATTPDSSTAAAVTAAATVKKTSTNNDSSHNPCSNNDDDDDVAVPTNGVAVTASVVTNSRCSHHPSIGRSLRTPGLFPQQLLRDIHDYDDDYCATIYDDSNNSPNTSSSQSAQNDEVGWLERLGYHVYKQGFPNNLNNLPPVPVLEVVPSSSSSSPVVPSSSSSTDAPPAVAVAAENYNFNATATTTNTNTNNYINNSGGSTTTEESKPLPSLTINSPDVSLELRSRDSPYGRNMRRWRRKYTANDTKPFPTL